jgi:hypothetical protein
MLANGPSLGALKPFDEPKKAYWAFGYMASYLSCYPKWVYAGKIGLKPFWLLTPENCC